MIIGLTDRGAQLPRLGILRKGAAKPNERQPGRDLGDHFRFECDDDAAARDFARAYGDRPNNIRVMFSYQTVSENFETWREHHSAGALKHRCDGQTCVLWLDKSGQYQHTTVPCPSIALKAGDPQINKMHLCRPIGRLKVVIPALQRMAYVLVPTTSINDILELQANLEAAQALRGDLRGIPFILSRRPRKVSTPTGENGQRARREKWLLSIEPAPDWVRLQLVAMERAALPMAETRLLAGPSVDETTGEIFDDDEPEETEPAPPPPAPTANGREDRRDRLINRIADLTGQAIDLAAEITLSKPLDEMTEDELVKHGLYLRAQIAAAELNTSAVRPGVVEDARIPDGLGLEAGYDEIDAAQR